MSPEIDMGAVAACHQGDVIGVGSLLPGAITNVGPGVAGAKPEQDGYYMLKKDSQRRATLSRVFSQDGKKICEVWMQSLIKSLGKTVLTMVILFFYSKYL